MSTTRIKVIAISPIPLLFRFPPMTHYFDVVVIIVNYNSGLDPQALPEGAAAQTLRPRQVMLVDNASTDGSAGTAAEALFAGLTIGIRCAENLGFAAANNLAMTRCEPDGMAGAAKSRCLS